MGGPFFGSWAHNIAQDAALSLVEGAVDSEFPLAHLVDGDPTEACKLTSTSAMLLMTFDAPVHISVASLHHHRCDPTLAVEFRGYTAAPSSSADPADLTGAPKVAIGAVDVDGFHPDAWFDVDAVDDDATFLYWAFLFPTNTLPLWFGELAAFDARVVPLKGFRPDEEEGPDVSTIINTTYGGVDLATRKQTRRKGWSGEMVGPHTRLVELVELFLEQGGAAAPMLFVPDSAAGEAALVRLTADSLRLKRSTGVFSKTEFALRELSRGLAWD